MIALYLYIYIHAVDELAVLFKTQIPEDDGETTR
jgi:hypothetical protein